MGDKCGAVCEVYSRVCGYFRPVANWNKGKKEEFRDRKSFRVAAVPAAMAQFAFGLRMAFTGCDAARDVGTQLRPSGQFIGRCGEDRLRRTENLQQVNDPLDSQSRNQRERNIIDGHRAIFVTFSLSRAQSRTYSGFVEA